jgi:hypothetical protein
VARFIVHQAHAHEKCEAHLYVLGRNLAYLILPVLCKNKCAKLAIATTGFKNPQKRKEKTKKPFKFPKLFL